MADYIWPFHSKVGTTEGGIGDSTTQWRRIDQGQDLQGLGPGEERVLAIASGVLHYEHDPGTGGAHFGDPYPMVLLDKPSPYGPSVYYGHTHPVVAEGTHVAQGQWIANTTTPGGGGAPEHWLEIGWWNVGPVGKGTGWTQAGQNMHNVLVNAPVFVIAQEIKEMATEIAYTDANHSTEEYLLGAGEPIYIPDPAEVQDLKNQGKQAVHYGAYLFDRIREQAGNRPTTPAPAAN